MSLAQRNLSAIFDAAHMRTFEVEVRANDGSLSCVAYMRFYTMGAAKASVESWIDRVNYRVTAIREMGISHG